jgi:predicted GNAT family acetyltransferase
VLKTSGGLRVLGADDLDAVWRLLERDPVTDVFVASRVEAAGLERATAGAEVWGFEERGELMSLCWAGANVVPVQATEAAVRAFAERARRTGRRCSSIVGASASVDPLWELLRPHWGPARDVRAGQPLMSIDADPLVPADPAVRPVRMDELDVIIPACVAMFTEEIGVSPLAGDGGALYRARVAELVQTGRAFARIEDGTVLFKAEIGAVSRSVCQVQGVWVHPSLRGRGLSAPGTAAVVALARQRIARVVSLYVNDYNVPARRAYERVGFRQVDTFTSVLF